MSFKMWALFNDSELPCSLMSIIYVRIWCCHVIIGIKTCLAGYCSPNPLGCRGPRLQNTRLTARVLTLGPRHPAGFGEEYTLGMLGSQASKHSPDGSCFDFGTTTPRGIWWTISRQTGFNPLSMNCVSRFCTGKKFKNHNHSQVTMDMLYQILLSGKFRSFWWSETIGRVRSYCIDHVNKLMEHFDATSTSVLGNLWLMHGSGNIMAVNQIKHK